jgi:hypothetical protein
MRVSVRPRDANQWAPGKYRSRSPGSWDGLDNHTPLEMTQKLLKTQMSRKSGSFIPRTKGEQGEHPKRNGRESRLRIEGTYPAFSTQGVEGRETRKVTVCHFKNEEVVKATCFPFSFLSQASSPPSQTYAQPSTGLSGFWI